MNNTNLLTSQGFALISIRSEQSRTREGIHKIGFQVSEHTGGSV
jgi:hypothetical protein